MLGNQISLTNNVAKQVVSVTATQGQTDFTVEGGYRINQLGVYRNGVRLVDGRDFIARNGATVTLLSQGANGDDAMEFVVFDDFRVADALSVNTGGTVNASVNITGALQMGTGTSIFSPADNTLTFGTNSAERVRIKSNGFVGIGTNNPTRNVELNNASGNAFISTKSQNTGFAGLLFGDQDADNRGQVTYSNNIDALILHTAGTEQVRITGFGSFGIGTNNPLGKLHVRPADECNFVVREETTSLILSAETNNGRDNNRLLTLEGAGLVINSGGNEKFRMTSGGDVGIATDNPAAKLQVAGSVMFGPENTTSQYQGIQLKNGRDSSANIATGFVDFRNNLNIPDGHIFVDHGTDGSSAMIFGTTPAGDRTTDRRAERFRIHSNGAVTKAANPLFKSNMGNVYGSAGSLVSSPSTAILQSAAEIDKGDNGWTTSGSNAYTFVCPVAGVYAVHAHFSLNDITQGNRAIFVIGYTDGGGNLPLSAYVEVMDTNVHDYQNYSYYNTFSFSAGTRIGFGMNGVSGTVSGFNSQWGIHLLQ